MSLTAPWLITYKNDEKEGYSEDICVECSNESKTVTSTYSI